jgi:general secretion pathway protein G
MKRSFTPLEKNYITKEPRFLTGFTLIELIVVIAIIAVLAAVIAPNAFRTIEKAKIAKAVSDIKAIKTAVMSYRADTKEWPPDYYFGADPNPFMAAPDGVSGWDGPYLDQMMKAHPWGGNINWRIIDIDDNGLEDYYITFDDDRFGTSSSDNGARIPRKSMIRIDQILDDGDLSTGNIQGNNEGFINTPVGEIAIISHLGGE